MTDSEILKKAIEQAENNGLKPKPYYRCIMAGEGARIERSFPDCFYHAAPVIFSHDFAKAFFPKTDDYGFSKTEYWQYHLQQMVLEADSIKYLEPFLIDTHVDYDKKLKLDLIDQIIEHLRENKEYNKRRGVNDSLLISILAGWKSMVKRGVR